MSMPKPEWWKYATFDEEGLSGIRDDAPQNIKEAYLADLEASKKISL